MEFYRNKKKSVGLILIYSGILLVLILIFIYSIGLFTDSISAKGIAISGIFGLILAVVIIKMLISLKDTSALLILSNTGITSKVTPVSKAAGLILWEDIADISLNKMGGDTLVTLTIDKQDRYIPIIRKKLSALAVNGANDEQGNLLIYLTASSLAIEAPELLAIIINFRKEINNSKIISDSKILS